MREIQEKKKTPPLLKNGGGLCFSTKNYISVSG